LGQNRRGGLPDAGRAPASEALVHRHPLAVLLRQVAPRRAGAHPPQNAVHDGPVVARRTTLAPALGRQEVFQQSPFRFAQIASTHEPLPPRGILESRFDSRVNHFVNRT
jgi:hypothetical protein